MSSTLLAILSALAETATGAHDALDLRLAPGKRTLTQSLPAFTGARQAQSPGGASSTVTASRIGLSSSQSYLDSILAAAPSNEDVGAHDDVDEDCAPDEAVMDMTEAELADDEAEPTVDGAVDGTVGCASCEALAATADESLVSQSPCEAGGGEPTRGWERTPGLWQRLRAWLWDRDTRECRNAPGGGGKRKRGKERRAARGNGRKRRRRTTPRRRTNTIRCVTRYQVDQHVVEVGEQPDVANKQTDKDFSLNDRTGVYVVEWDMHDIPDRMVIVNRDTGAVLVDTGMVSGRGRIVLAGPMNIHVRVIPNDGTDNPTLAGTVYRFQIVKAAQEVQETTTCYWRRLPIGRRVRTVTFDPDADYRDKVVRVTRRQARQILRDE